jgi:hypothetical protein
MSRKKIGYPIFSFFLYERHHGHQKNRMSRETMWQLFNIDPRTISDHITNIYKSEELTENSTRRKIRRVQIEGNRQVTREIDFYNLDLVISVGYRVNSVKDTQFRKFVTRILHEYIQKGFVINDDRFKNGNKFDEIRLIRYNSFNS